MPIHDQSYRRYAGARGNVGRAWLVIARVGIRTMIRRRLFLALLLLAWVPFLVRTVQIYIASTFPQAAMLTPGADTFRDFLHQQGTFIFFVTIYAGAGLIANDSRANALQIYLSKPLSRAEYVAGKLAVLVAFLLLVTWVPAMMLLAVQTLFAGTTAFLREHAFLVPAITVFSLLQVLLASFTILALSSLSKSSRYVGILYTGAVLFTDAIYGVLRVVTGGTTIAWVSFPANLAQIGDVIFRLPPRYAVPWTASLLVIVVLVALSMLVLEHRVRGVEVVT